ncbi:MAG: hypothetical protein Q7S37_01205 [bacterium]|nr:hypothetical protein [bacterium]
MSKDQTVKKEDDTIYRHERDVLKKFLVDEHCNYSETGAKLEFTHNLRNSVEKLNKSTSLQNWIMIVLTIVLITLTIILLSK